MIKMKRFYVALVILVVLCLTGCSGKESVTEGYNIYYTNSDRTLLLCASYSIKEDDPLKLAKEMFEKMCEPGNSSEQVSLVPKKLEAVLWDLTDGQLTVTFNAEYLNIETINEVMFRAGFVETMIQIEGVKKIVFHIGNDVLKNHSGEPVGAMTKNTFIHNPVGINSYQYAALTLYFASPDKESIVREVRNLHYSSNITLQKVVMEQLMKGPLNKNLNPILDEEARVLDITLQDKTCVVNMNQAFLDAGDHLDMPPEVVIYAIVNSLCDVLQVDKVQFKIEGESTVKYAGTLSFNGPFHRNSGIIAKQDSLQEFEADEGNLDFSEPQIGL